MAQGKIKKEIETKEFIAYLEIYGNNGRLLTIVFDEFETTQVRLSKKDLRAICEFLENKSQIPASKIHHTVLDIRQDEEI